MTFHELYLCFYEFPSCFNKSVHIGELFHFTCSVMGFLNDGFNIGRQSDDIKALSDGGN